MAKRGKSGRKSGRRTKRNGNTMRRRGGDAMEDLKKKMAGGADFDPSVLAKKMQGGRRKSKGRKSRRRSTKRH